MQHLPESSVHPIVSLLPSYIPCKVYKTYNLCEIPFHKKMEIFEANPKQTIVTMAQGIIFFFKYVNIMNQVN